MELSQKQETFYQFFAAFLKSRLNSKHFEKKNDPRSFFIFEITESENVVRQMSKMSRVGGCLYKQYGKCAKAPSKSLSRHFILFIDHG